MADVVTNNYVVGRGRLFFGQFKPSTRKSAGQLYFGNTPELSTSQNEDKLDHYSSEGGVRIKDASVTLQNDSTGSFQCDNIIGPNLALWFRGLVQQRLEAGSSSAQGTITFANAVPVDGDTVTINGHQIEFVAANPVGPQVLIAGTIAAQAELLAGYISNNAAMLGVNSSVAGATVTVTSTSPGSAGNTDTLAKTAATAANIVLSGATLAGGTDVTETLTDIYKGRWYQLGVADDLPQGVRKVGSVSIDGIAPESYIVEEDTGRIYFNLDAVDVTDGQAAEVTFGVAAHLEEVVIAKGDSIEGELIFLANNAAGDNRDYYWPYVRLTPNGDFALKGDDWQAITFDFEILKRDDRTERQYITKR